MNILAFQGGVGDWMKSCFTEEIIQDKLERSDRFIEESLELVQACGYSADRAHALVDYVFNRPVGEPFQETGGVMVTLAALCNPHGIDMSAAAETELARVWTKIEQIRSKQATKPVGSALPIPH
jgi:NTP pyrophosphatase (non-canonical NTP hydrolase)